MAWQNLLPLLFMANFFRVNTVLGKTSNKRSVQTKVYQNRCFHQSSFTPYNLCDGCELLRVNDIIVDLSEQNNVYWTNAMPISIEYLVFTMLFALMILLENGVKGLSDFSISTLFLGIIGFIYTIDSIYPFGTFAPFQIFVPTIAMLAANVLNLMRYQTSIATMAPSIPLRGSYPTY